MGIHRDMHRSDSNVIFATDVSPRKSPFERTCCIDIGAKMSSSNAMFAINGEKFAHEFSNFEGDLTILSDFIVFAGIVRCSIMSNMCTNVPTSRFATFAGRRTIRRAVCPITCKTIS